MSNLCINCSTEMEEHGNVGYSITNGVCLQCVESIFGKHNSELTTFLDNLEAPILLMQSDPRQVKTANKQACELFKKELSQIEGHRGGQVFDCVYAFTKDGCGKDVNCEDCKIKNAVVETFTSGKSSDGASTVLDIKNNDSTIPYKLRVSTEKVGELALIRIDQYEKKD